jgi:hypothetical protein
MDLGLDKLQVHLDKLARLPKERAHGGCRR